MEGDKNITRYVATVKIRSQREHLFIGKTGMSREFEYSSRAFERKHATGFASAGFEGYVEDGAEGGCSARGWSVEIACVYKANGLKITERRAP